MDYLNFLSIVWPNGFWPSLIKLFSFVGNYAWIIVIFTICLKLILFPLDFAQRFFSNKTARAQAKIQPQLEKLKKQYGQNTTLLYQKQNELYQKNGVSSRGSCVFMLLYLVLTIVIFITLFNSMQFIARYNLQDQYKNLQTDFYTSYNSQFTVGYLSAPTGEDSPDKIYTEEEMQVFIDAKVAQIMADESKTEEEAKAIVTGVKDRAISDAQTAAKESYSQINNHWLWVKNMYIADNATYSAIPDYNQYVGLSGDKETSEVSYNLVMGKILSADNLDNGANGYFILSILVVGISFLSQFIMRRTSQYKDKNGNSVPMPTASKVMLIIMPLTMLMFTLNSSAVFSVYVLTNTVMSTLLAPLSTKISNKIEGKKEAKEEAVKKVDYRR